MNLSRRQFLGLLPAIPVVAMAVVKAKRTQLISRCDLPIVQWGDPNYVWIADTHGAHPVPRPKISFEMYDCLGNSVVPGLWVYTE